MQSRRHSDDKSEDWVRGASCKREAGRDQKSLDVVLLSEVPFTSV